MFCKRPRLSLWVLTWHLWFFLLTLLQNDLLEGQECMPRKDTGLLSHPAGIFSSYKVSGDPGKITFPDFLEGRFHYRLPTALGD